MLVGAGIAGLTLASRLSRNAVSGALVSLVEAGEKSKVNLTLPRTLVAPILRGSEPDWRYEITSQKHLGSRNVYEVA